MNSKLREKLTACEAKLSFEDWNGVTAGWDNPGIVKVRLVLKPNDVLPKLYDRGVWLADIGDEYYAFSGEIEERYIQDNACMLNVRILDGLYKVSRYEQESLEDEREAIIISSSSEKFVVNILKLDPNHAIVRSQVLLPEHQKVWLRYRELAIAGFTGLEQSKESQYIYNLDFSVETIEKRGRIAEMILKENGKGISK